MPNRLRSFLGHRQSGCPGSARSQHRFGFAVPGVNRMPVEKRKRASKSRGSTQEDIDDVVRLMKPQRGTALRGTLERHLLLRRLRSTQKCNAFLSQSLVDGLLADLIESVDNDRWIAAICL